MLNILLNWKCCFQLSMAISNLFEHHLVLRMQPSTFQHVMNFGRDLKWKNNNIVYFVSMNEYLSPRRIFWRDSERLTLKSRRLTANQDQLHIYPCTFSKANQCSLYFSQWERSWLKRWQFSSCKVNYISMAEQKNSKYSPKNTKLFLQMIT